VRLDFPAGSVTSETVITYTPSSVLPTQNRVGFSQFELAAQRVSDGFSITSFDPPYTLTVSYAGFDLGAADEDTLGIYYHDGNRWLLEPTNTIDKVNKNLIATPEHMSRFAIFAQIPIWKIYLPLLSQ
jgi:hypothetical protein